MNAKTIKLIAQIEPMVKQGRKVDFTGLVCCFGFNAPVGKALDAMMAMGMIVEAGKNDLGHTVWVAA
jgi:hypothetical protein